VPTSARGGSVTAVSSPAKPTPNSLLAAVVAVLNVAVLVLSLVTGFPVWLSVAVIAAPVAGVAAWRFAPRWRLRTTVLSATCAAVLFAFAAEGVRGALTEDTPSTHRYFVVEQVFPTIAPDTNAGEAVGTGLLFPGDTVDVVCLRGGSWAKLDDGSWVPEHAVQAEVDAEPAPHC
jgi:hypothetical protein